MKFSVDLDISSAVKLTNAIAKQVPFAMAKALTQTAIQAQTDIVQAMTQVFDRPTPYTLNSTYVVPATKDRLESFVQLKDSAAKGTPAIKFLDPEVFGGGRNPKRGERALQRMEALAFRLVRRSRCRTQARSIREHLSGNDDEDLRSPLLHLYVRFLFVRGSEAHGYAKAQVRIQDGVTMPEIVTTPMSYFEALIEYERPNILLWLDRAGVVQALFDAFARWNVTVDDVEILTTGKPSEQGIKFRLPEKLASFFFSPAACRFTRDNTSWETAQETIEILDAGVTTLAEIGHVKPATFKTIVALHIQPTNLPFIEILKKIIPAPMAALEPTVPQTMASVVKWDKRKVTIDGSGQIANGIFIRYEREFKADVGYEAIAQQLRADEDGIFAMLDVKEEA